MLTTQQYFVTFPRRCSLYVLGSGYSVSFRYKIRIVLDFISDDLDQRCGKQTVLREAATVDHCQRKVRWRFGAGMLAALTAASQALASGARSLLGRDAF